MLSFLSAFSLVLVWMTSETASKNTSFLSKTHEWGQEKIKQNKNASVSKILCFVFTAAKTDTLYKKRTLERINITSVVPSKHRKKEFIACLDVTIFTSNTRINSFCGENVWREDVVWKNLSTSSD